MSKIAFFCIPAHGHTNPTLEVVRELKRRGHQVRYYSYEPFRQKLEAAGAEFVPCDAYDQELHLPPDQAVRIGKDLALSVRVLVDTTLALDDMVCRDMAQWRPDCVVGDSMAVWGKLAARKCGIPFVSSTTTFAFNQESAKIMKQSLGQVLGMLVAMPRIQRDLKRLRDRGYPVETVLDLIQSSPDTHTVVYTSPQFQPCAQTFSDRYAFVGPSIRPVTERYPKTRPLRIYISMGTVNNRMAPLYRRCIRALAGPDRQVLLAVGDQVAPASLGPLPEGVEVFSRVDQIGVLSQTDVFLTHCGMNSVSEALYFGVPLMMLPQTPEQGGVATRVEQLGAGIRLKGTELQTLEAATERLLTDRRYGDRARAIGDGFRACSGAPGAADKILSLCAGA